MLNKIRSYFKAHPRALRALNIAKYCLLAFSIAMFAFIALYGTISAIKSTSKSVYASALSDDSFSVYFIVFDSDTPSNYVRFVSDSSFIPMFYGLSYDSYVLVYPRSTSLTFFTSSSSGKILFYSGTYTYATRPDTVSSGTSFSLTSVAVPVSSPNPVGTGKEAEFYSACFAAGGKVVTLNINGGYDTGYSAGYTFGYNEGFSAGQSDQLKNPIDFVLTPVNTFLSFKIFGVVSIGTFLAISCFVALAVIFLKMFAGG